MGTSPHGSFILPFTAHQSYFTHFKLCQQEKRTNWSNQSKLLYHQQAENLVGFPGGPNRLNPTVAMESDKVNTLNHYPFLTNGNHYL